MISLRDAFASAIALSPSASSSMCGLYFNTEIAAADWIRFAVLATFRRKIGWRWLLDRIDWFAENCKIGRIWVDVGRDH